MSVEIYGGYKDFSFFVALKNQNNDIKGILKQIYDEFFSCVIFVRNIYYIQGCTQKELFGEKRVIVRNFHE